VRSWLPAGPWAIFPLHSCQQPVDYTKTKFTLSTSRFSTIEALLAGRRRLLRRQGGFLPSRKAEQSLSLLH